MNEDRILIIDDDAATASFLRAAFAEAGLEAESVNDAFSAMEMLREKAYCAVVLDPMIRHRLNGYAVLNFIEMEQPETIERLFLLTGMSEQTIRRTAPSVLPRLFRKPAAMKAATAIIAACGRNHDHAELHAASVLLVEDDPATANATRRILNELGYSVEWAQNGCEALEILTARDFEAIMLDLVMPQVDGFTLLEHFHSERPGLLRRVIVTTGMPEKYVEALKRCTVAGIVQKPLDLEQLARLLRDCVSRFQK
jgi:DNA-binding NtrC family response regulator